LAIAPLPNREKPRCPYRPHSPTPLPPPASKTDPAPSCLCVLLKNRKSLHRCIVASLHRQISLYLQRVKIFLL
ncbi:MAG: hypothetical protein IKE94_12820, partial [Aeriscardovia sp.]|nr:hypothetical protein [Aeriscardovia sp.]